MGLTAGISIKGLFKDNKARAKKCHEFSASLFVIQKGSHIPEMIIIFSGTGV